MVKDDIPARKKGRLDFASEGIKIGLQRFLRPDAFGLKLQSITKFTSANS